MGSELKDKIPTIDFGKLDLKEGSEEWNSVRDQVYKASEEYGAFEAIIDDATLSITKERLFEKLKQVFSLPLKTLIPMCEKTGNGFHFIPSVPLHEALNIKTGLMTPGIIENISKTLWPNGDQEFCDLVRAYAKRVSALSEMTRKMFFDKLGVENLWDEHNKSTFDSLALIKYRLPNTDEEKVGLIPHKDPQISAILSQHEIGASGLQVMKKNGQWLDCEFSSPHSYVFLVAQCLTALTNGRLHAPVHQVISGDKERFAIAAFTGFEGIIQVPEKIVDEDHPLRYKPFDATEFIHSTHKNYELTVDEYCGV